MSPPVVSVTARGAESSFVGAQFVVVLRLPLLRFATYCGRAVRFCVVALQSSDLALSGAYPHNHRLLICPTIPSTYYLPTGTRLVVVL